METELTYIRNPLVQDHKNSFRCAIVLGTDITAIFPHVNFDLFQSLFESMGESFLALFAFAYLNVTVYGRALSRGRTSKDWLIFAFAVLGTYLRTVINLLLWLTPRLLPLEPYLILRFVYLHVICLVVIPLLLFRI